MTTPSVDTHVKNKKTITIVFILVALMIGLAFASVPLYRIFCQVTGYGGTTQRAEASGDQNVLPRIITVRFNADISSELPWEFKPNQISVDVNIGADSDISYTAKNISDDVTVGTAVFNVTPLKAGKYFNKVVCFCFSEQVLKPGEEVNMPVSFFIDPSLVDDPNLDDVNTVTLSYTFFKGDSAKLDNAIEEFYNK